MSAPYATFKVHHSAPVLLEATDPQESFESVLRTLGALMDMAPHQVNLHHDGYDITVRAHRKASALDPRDGMITRAEATAEEAAMTKDVLK